MDETGQHETRAQRSGGLRIVATCGGGAHLGRFHAMIESADVEPDIAACDPGDVLIGTGNALILISVEVARAIANAGDMPPMFARTNANGVATGSLLTAAAIGILLVAASMSDSFVEAFAFISLVSAIGALVLYIVCAAAAWKLRAVPALFGLVAILYSLAMFYGSGLEPVLWAGALMLAGLPVRWFSRKRWPNRVAVPSQA